MKKIIVVAIVCFMPLIAFSAQWRVLPIRSEQEFLKGKIGGEAEQHLHGMARSQSHPEILYMSQDVGQVWKSVDSGESWRKTLGKGLYLNFGQSIEVDPVNPNKVFVIVAPSYNWLAPSWSGLYRSFDGGDNWERVLRMDLANIRRIYQHAIAYDPASANNSEATRWYAATPDHGLVRSDDGGASWTQQLGLRDVQTIYDIKCHPSDGRTVYAGTNAGLYRSANRGENLALYGNLPAGAVASIEINPDNSQMIYAVILGNGLYRSLDGGANFSLLKSFSAARLFMNYGYPNKLYLIGTVSRTIMSSDGGLTWYENTSATGAEGLGREYKRNLYGELSALMPNPKDENEAVGYSRASCWKTTDGGRTYFDSSTLFTGFACSWWADAVAFDRFNPGRFATFNCDVGTNITDNNGDFFRRRNDQAWNWYSVDRVIDWIGTYSGDIQPVENSQVMVASIGHYWRTKIMRTADEGRNWQLVTDVNEQNLFISFHPDDPNLVFAGSNVSKDAGLTFNPIDFGEYNQYSPAVMGMCFSFPDTLYALDSGRQRILRSDDRGNTWRLYAQGGFRCTRLDSLPTFACDPVDRDKVYAMSSSYDLAVFNGTSWNSLGVLQKAGGQEQGNFVRAVAIDPRHPEIIYAGMFAAGLPCAFRSTDGGASWEDISENLPRVGIGTLYVSPHTGDVLFGSCIGTWVYPPPYPSSNLIYDKAHAYSPEPEIIIPEAGDNSVENQGSVSTAFEVRNNILKDKNMKSEIIILIAKSGNVSVKIFDSKGKEIITIFDGHREAGSLNLSWDGTDASGKKVGSGVYMVHMQAGSYKETKKIVIVR